ncbi:MAG: 50S ribosomal protein L6 [Patescibacteria group bacterium]|nr:50S ribosomal protein L6 [Patescibacteria group bacterium]
MSRVGKKPVQIPSGVEVKIEGDKMTVKGPKGSLDLAIHPLVNVAVEGDEVKVSVNNESEIKERALWGLFARLIGNMVTGVSVGFEKKLEVNGVGYKVSVQGNVLKLDVGFSHSVDFPISEGLDISVEKNVITVRGIDKQAVGEAAASIRRVRKPEPYKGKGIKYVDEVIHRKAGKASKAAAG